MTENKKTMEISQSAVMFVGVLMMAMMGFGGYLYGKVNSLQNSATAPTAQQPAAQQPEEPAMKLADLPEVTDKDHIRGSKDADIVMVEYSDYECPFCKSYHPTMQKVMQEYGKKVAWVFRQYPLSFHPKAQKTAEAAECAAELGGNDAFWKLSDAMYEKMPTMELADLPAMAKTIGLDQGKFKTCLDSGKFANKVAADEAGGVKAGVQGTPGTVIVGKNGKREFVNGAMPYESVKQLIDKVLNG